MKNENVRFRFGKFEYESTNPTGKTLIITVLILTCFVVLAALLGNPIWMRLLSG